MTKLVLVEGSAGFALPGVIYPLTYLNIEYGNHQDRRVDSWKDTSGIEPGIARMAYGRRLQVKDGLVSVLLSLVWEVGKGKTKDTHTTVPKFKVSNVSGMMYFSFALDSRGVAQWINAISMKSVLFAMCRPKRSLRFNVIYYHQ